MAGIEIRSRMDHFRMIDAIRRVNRKSLEGMSAFKHAPPFAGLEAMAQLAALHVRYRVDFRRHAFLLKVIHCQGLPGEDLDGEFRLRARLESHSRNACHYAVQADGKGRTVFASELLIGICDYDERFRGQHLRGHYRKMFAGLDCRISH